MELRDRIEYVLTKPFNKKLFINNALKVLLPTAKLLAIDEVQVKEFVQNLFKYKFTKVRINPLEMRKKFGALKMDMIFRMSLKAHELYGVPFHEVPLVGKHSVKFEIRDSFTTKDSEETIRQKWGDRKVVFWNIINGFKWEKTIFCEEQLKGANILDYGCNIGALAHLARRHGCKKVTLVDVPGETLNFAGSFIEPDREVIEVRGDVAPIKGPFDVAFCCHVLEHTPDPLQVVTKIYQELKTGGFFHATFIGLTTEGGINLVKAQELRNKTLNFLKTTFKVLYWNEGRTQYLLKKI